MGSWVILLDNLIDLSLVFAISALVVASCVPQLQDFFKYGKSIEPTQLTNGYLLRLLDLKIPKSWFSHFYLISLLEVCLIFVCIPFNPANKFSIALALSLVQSVRRFYECVFVSVRSKSQIHVSHYLVGIYFYAALNLNNWLKHMYISDAEPKCAIMSLIIFTTASIDQAQNHRYLASLPKYDQPVKGLFAYSSCAHYFDEIAIYFAYWLMLRTRTSFLLLGWVAVSLSISSNHSYNYYLQKGNKVNYRIIPFVY